MSTAHPLNRLNRFVQNTFHPRTHSRSPRRVVNVSYAQVLEQQPERWCARRAWKDWIGNLYEEALKDPLPEYTLHRQDRYQHQHQWDKAHSGRLKVEELEVTVISSDDDVMAQGFGAKPVLRL
ncbi:hypothetical protein BGX24_001410 [Mortierella sp. AD032]|nr:hypothetical protein BGX24_001410 [Mortierella sp. AD032]